MRFFLMKGSLSARTATCSICVNTAGVVGGASNLVRRSSHCRMAAEGNRPIIGVVTNVLLMGLHSVLMMPYTCTMVTLSVKRLMCWLLLITNALAAEKELQEPGKWRSIKAGILGA